MNLIRNTIRKILFEQMSEEEELAEFKKWHKPKEAEVAVDEITDMFKLKDWWETGSWGNERKMYEVEYEPEPNCIVRMRVQASYGGIYLDEIETTPDCEGKGYATEAINMIKTVAKKHMVKIRLEAKAFHTHKGEGRMSTASLRSWYVSLGFKPRGWFPGDKPLQWLPK